MRLRSREALEPVAGSGWRLQVIDRADAIVRQIERAYAERAGIAGTIANLDDEAVRQQVLRLIDTPEAKRVLWVDDRPGGNTREAAALAKLQIEVVSVR